MRIVPILFIFKLLNALKLNKMSLSCYCYQDNDDGNIYPIDDLVYTYEYNRLKRVVDGSNSIDGFKDGQNPDGPLKPDYEHDLNGNMTQDWNKGISEITYNHLDLPVKIKFGADGLRQIDYLYNAQGVKVGKIVDDRTVTPVQFQKTDYLGGFQYVESKLQFFPTAEGYVSVTDGKFNYVYNYTDHLGNVRLSYTQPKPGEPLAVLEESHYYPFGMKHSNYNTQKSKFKKDANGGIYAVLVPVERSDYQYKFNGQEYQDELGLNMTAMDFRQYDNALGRFHSVDVLAELMPGVTPYHFGFNNPVYWSDPTGLVPGNEGEPEKPRNDGVLDEVNVYTNPKNSRYTSMFDLPVLKAGDLPYLFGGGNKQDPNPNKQLAKRIADKYGYDWKDVMKFLDENPFILTHKGVAMGGVEVPSSKKIEDPETIDKYIEDQGESYLKDKLIEFISPKLSDVLGLAETLLTSQAAHGPSSSHNVDQLSRELACRETLIRHFFEKPITVQTPTMFNNQQSYQYHSSRFDKLRYRFY